jgi:molybdenum cofactor synthesis domain-containing protein
LPGGTLVRAAEWGLLASLEQESVWVAKRPRVRLIVTGDEVTPIGEALQNGAIRDSNSWTLRALIGQCGADVEIVRVSDDVEQFRAALAGDCDAIITSGGISMGDFDIVRDVLPELALIHFYKVAMKPGKPVMFGTLKERLTPVFALPGNPVSVMVSFELFVRPALLQMQGRTALKRPVVEAVLQSSLHSPENKVEWARAVVSQEVQPDSTVLWQARVDTDQGSGRLSTMTRANALLEIPVGVSSVGAGQTVRAHLTDCAEIE